MRLQRVNKVWVERFPPAGESTNPLAAGEMEVRWPTGNRFRVFKISHFAGLFGLVPAPIDAGQGSP